MFLIWIAFIVFLHGESVESRDVFIKHVSGTKIVKPGSEANIICEYYVRTEKYHRVWAKSNSEGLQTVSFDDLLVLDDDRYSVKTYPACQGRNEVNCQTLSLSIRNVTVEDSGTYDCRVYLADETGETRKSSLYVFAPEIRHRVLEGDDVILQCFPEKFFQLNEVTWTADHFPEGVVVNRDLMTFPSALKADSGVYTCKATFHLPETEPNRLRTFSRRILLEVFPLLEVTAHKPLIFRPLNYDVNITCFVRSLTPVKVTWFKNNLLITNQTSFSKSLIPREMFMVDFKSANKFLANYKQKVQNVEPSKNISTNKTDDSLPLSNYRLSMYESESGEYSTKSLKIATLQMSSINISDYGEYRCMVENSFTNISKVVRLLSTKGFNHK